MLHQRPRPLLKSFSKPSAVGGSKGSHLLDDIKEWLPTRHPHFSLITATQYGGVSVKKKGSFPKIENLSLAYLTLPTSTTCPSLLFHPLPLRSEGTQPLQMASSPKKGSSNSPKRMRKGQTLASETGSADFNNEDYNIRSPERTKLLTQIKKVIGNVSVSPAFWACCQLADMSDLQDIAKSPRQMILGIEDSFTLLPLKCEL
jgi:hypothetical protein